MPSRLIPRLLVVFTWQLEILVTTLTSGPGYSVALYTLYSTGLLLGQCGFDGVRTTPQGFLHCVFNYIRFRTLVLDT